MLLCKVSSGQLRADRGERPLACILRVYFRESEYSYVRADAMNCGGSIGRQGQKIDDQLYRQPLSSAVVGQVQEML